MSCVVGYEVSGIVEASGDQLNEQWIGEEVVALTRFGGYSEFVCVPKTQVFSKPKTLSLAAAASLPVTYLTAYQLVVVMGSLAKGESILIHNAGGGVGLAVLDFAEQKGAITYGTASRHKHGFLQERGLDHPIDYRTQDWLKELKRLTCGRGVELITDPFGGASWKRSYRALRATGRMGMFGISSVTESKLVGRAKILKLLLQAPFYHPFGLLDSNKGVFGVNLGHMWEEGEKVARWMNAILAGVNEGWVRPHVDKKFSFENACEAHAYIEERKNIGKVVLVPE